MAAAPKPTAEEKAKAKADTKAEALSASQLARAQESSRAILAQELRTANVPKAEISRIIKAEAQADKAEVAAYKQTAKAPGLQAYEGYQQRELTADEILRQSPAARGRGLTAEDVQGLINDGTVAKQTVSTGYIAADYTTVNPQYADAVARAVQRQAGGIQLLSDLGLQQAFKSGKTSVGYSTLAADALTGAKDASGNFVVNPGLAKQANTSGRGAKVLVQDFNTAQRFVKDDQLTAEDIGSVLKPISGSEDFFTSKLRSDKKGGSVGTFLKNEDGTYDYIGMSKSFTPTNGGGLGGFLKRALPSIGLTVIGSAFGVPSLGSVLGATGATATAINAASTLASIAYSQYKTDAEYQAAVASGQAAGLDSLFTNYFQQLDAAAQAGPDVVEADIAQANQEFETRLNDLRNQNDAAATEFASRMEAQQQAGAGQSAELERLRAENQAAAESNRMALEGSQRDFAARRAARRRAAGRGRGGLLSGFGLQQRSLGNSGAATSLGAAGATTLAGA